MRRYCAIRPLFPMQSDPTVLIFLRQCFLWSMNITQARGNRALPSPVGKPNRLSGRRFPAHKVITESHKASWPRGRIRKHRNNKKRTPNTGTTTKNTAESQHLKCAQSTKATMRKRFRIFREACVGKETTSPHSIQHRKQSRRPLKGYLPHVKSDHSEAECFLPSTCPQFGYSSCDRMCCKELMRKKQSGQRSAHNFGQRPTI